MTKRRLVFACIGLLGLGCLIPFPMTVIPEWTLRVVDETDSPWIRKDVRRIYNNYSVEFHGEETLVTDDQGFVTFPKINSFMPVGWRVIRTAFAYLTLIAHGSVGHSSTVDASGPDGTEWLSYDGDGVAPSKLVLPRQEMPTLIN